MSITITRIRSGGQSGVDRAALDFARKHNMEICGWCPKGGWAEDYPVAPGLAYANGIELCIGGPRASECPEGYRMTMEILEKILEELE